jgi:hypothetical protein
MTYKIHIERTSGEILLQEWKAAVAATRGVRLHPGQFATVVATGEIIRIGSQDGDAEVYFPKQRKWHIVFRWFQGTASFTPVYPPGDMSYPAWKAAAALASHLQAVITSDSGEIFDLKTGKVSNS